MPENWWKMLRSQSCIGQPLHAYTKGLLDSVPRVGQDKTEVALRAIPGRIPSPLWPPFRMPFFATVPHRYRGLPWTASAPREHRRRSQQPLYPLAGDPRWRGRSAASPFGGLVHLESRSRPRDARRDGLGEVLRRAAELLRRRPAATTPQGAGGRWCRSVRSFGTHPRSGRRVWQRQEHPCESGYRSESTG